MQIEVTLPNRDGSLMPGAYVQVLLPLQSSQAMTIPTNALMVRGEGMRDQADHPRQSAAGNRGRLRGDLPSRFLTVDDAGQPSQAIIRLDCQRYPLGRDRPGFE